MIGKLLKALEKDIKLFFRDRRTLFLVFFTPILIMLVLGLIFSGDETEKSLKNIKLGVCNMDKSNFEVNVSLFSPVFFEGSCNITAERSVREGNLRGAITIPSGFADNIEEGYGSTMILYVDNSKAQIAMGISNAIRAYVEQMNEAIGTKFIETAWINLRRLNSRLKIVVENLGAAKSTAQSIQQETLALRQSLDQINTTKAREYAEKANQTLLELEDEFDTLAGNLNSSLNNSFANFTYNDSFDALRIRIEALGFDLDPEIERLKLIYGENCNVSGPGIDMVCASLNDSIYRLENSYEMFEDQKSSIILLLNRTEEQANSFFYAASLYQNQTNSTIARLIEMKQNISDRRKAMEMIGEQVILIEETKIKVDEKLDNMEGLVVNFTNQVISLQEELNATTVLLDKYTSRDPRNIVRAVTLDEEKLFGRKRAIDFMAPALLCIIIFFILLLISSSLIVEEKRRGTMLRNLLSPTSLWFLLVAKVIYLLLLSALQIAVVFLILLLLGVSIPFSAELFLILAAISFSFVSLGALIGTISKTENAALLTSLVVAIPMLFLSGVFFPFEMMPTAMGAIGKYLPLTLAVNNLERLWIYGTGINAPLIRLLLYIGVGLFLVSVFFLWRNPTAE